MEAIGTSLLTTPLKQEVVTNSVYPDGYLLPSPHILVPIKECVGSCVETGDDEDEYCEEIVIEYLDTVIDGLHSHTQDLPIFACHPSLDSRSYAITIDNFACDEFVSYDVIDALLKIGVSLVPSTCHTETINVLDVIVDLQVAINSGSYAYIDHVISSDLSSLVICVIF